MPQAAGPWQQKSGIGTGGSQEKLGSNADAEAGTLGPSKAEFWIAGEGDAGRAQSGDAVTSTSTRALPCFSPHRHHRRRHPRHISAFPVGAATLAVI